MEFNKLKLIIWDLDETFWVGTISDGEVLCPKKNIELIKNLINCGVMCSICSKNEEDLVRKELIKIGLLDYFVFNSINWTSKGERVRQIVEEMNLRPANVMFIDDNSSNRAEVMNICKDITVEDVDIIPKLTDYFEKTEKNDLQHKRLNQYKVLEKKKSFKAKFANNEDFLYNSNVKVKIKEDCLNHIDRIHELLQRSNQLNFTKKRDSKEDLLAKLNDPSIKNLYVEVTDNFGDYGLIGFVSFTNKEVLHFVFSCRTLGMGVEQYVYKMIGKPKLEVIGEVASDLNSTEALWINQKNSNKFKKNKSNIEGKIIIKGPCDMEQMFAYIATNKNLKTEFVYVNKKGVNIEQVNHTLHILQSKSLTDEIKVKLSEKYPFSDKNMYKTDIFNSDVDIVVLSLFTDPNLGVYLDLETQATIAFGEYTNDLTDSRLRNKFINKELFTANCDFTSENLEFLEQNLLFKGRLSPEEVCENVKKIKRNLANTTHLILILGSEIPYLGNKQEAYRDRHEYNKELNSLILDFVEHEDNVSAINVTNYINNQEDFTNNINHFKREIYYKMSMDIVSIVDKVSGTKIKRNGKILVFLFKFYRKLKKLPQKVKRLISKI